MDSRFFSTPDLYHVHLLLIGLITLLASIVPNLLKNKTVTAPVVYLIIGVAISFNGDYYTTIAALNNVDIIKKISEFVVIVSLVNAGLKIKRPFSWKTWKHSFWLLLVTMPISIVASAWLGWWIVGLSVPSALLFGALIAPTDPVLAADLQTSEPSKNDTSKTRLALTSEAGLNDGLAFPFTYFAIFMVNKGADYSSWIGDWFLTEVVYKIFTGTAIGFLFGYLLCKIVFRFTTENQRSKISRGILSLAITLVPYAISEIVGGYGFIAVFVAACTFSNSDQHSRHMDSLHDFTEEIERIFVALLFVVIGVYMSTNFEALFQPMYIFTALVLILILRPVAGFVALARTNLTRFEKFAISFYGIRGVGSIFYLAYALGEAPFENFDELIRLTVVTIVFSVFIHGLSAATIQKKLNEYDQR